MTDPVPSKDLTFEERCALARKAAVGDRWRKRKQHEHFCLILANDGHGNLKLAHWNRRVTHKWYHYLASEYEPIPAQPATANGLRGDLPSDEALHLLDEIERLRTTLTGISTCSTCEACRGAALRALGERTVEEINAAVDERLDRVERELAQPPGDVYSAVEEGVRQANADLADVISRHGEPPKPVHTILDDAFRAVRHRHQPPGDGQQ